MAFSLGPRYCYLLKIAYDGTGFRGWQVQKDALTVQGELERALSAVFDGPIRVVASGRTDTGVHALGQTAHFKTQTYRPPDSVFRALQKMLPGSVAILGVEVVDPKFHARYWARLRTYIYWIRLTRKPDPFLERLSWSVEPSLRLGLLDEALSLFEGTHDFSAFAVKSSDRNPLVTMKAACLIGPFGDNLYFVFRASHFLRRMVRIMVSCLIEVGFGRMGAESIRSALESASLGRHLAPAPARGLYLAHVLYPEGLKVFERYPNEEE